jgi:hypothetical protein
MATTSNSIISFVNIADRAVSPVAMQSTCTQDLATSMKSDPVKRLGFFLYID